MSGDEGNVRREDVPVRRTERRRQYTDPHRGWRCTETVRTTIVKGRQPKGARSSPRPPAKTEPAPVGEEAHRANDGPESVREESESWPSPPRPFPAAGFGDGDARELVSLWRRVFPDARLLGELGTPSRSGGVVIVVHRVPLGCREHATNRRDAITVNGLFARSALAGALGYYSVERTGGSTLNLYRVTLPDLPGCGGRRSVLQCYVSALAAAGMGIASASPSRDWSGASVFPACVPLTTVAHQSADMDAGAFSRLTLQALDGAVQLARVGIARIESDPSTRARALCALTIFPSSASGPLPHERPRLAAACREMGHDRGASRPLVGGGVGDRADDGPCGDVDTPDGDGDPEAERASGHVPGVGARATRGRAPSRGRVPLRAVTTRVIQCNGYDGVGAEAWNEALTAPPRAAEADSDDDDAGASVAAGSCAWDARNARWSLRDRFDAHKRTIPN